MSQVYSVCFSPDGRILASGSAHHTVRLWEVETGECLHILPGHTGAVTSIGFSADGHTLASGGGDQTVRLWNVHTGECLRSLQGHTSWLDSICLSLDGHALASAHENQTVRLWAVETNDNFLSILLLLAPTGFSRNWALRSSHESVRTPQCPLKRGGPV